MTKEVEKKEEKPIEIGEGLSVTKTGENKFIIPRGVWADFMTRNGLTEDTLKRVSTVEALAHGAMLKFAGDQVVKSGSADTKVTVAVQLKEETTEVSVKGMQTFQNPAGGDPVTHYGICSIKVSKTPPLAMRRDGGICELIEADCRAAFTKGKKK